MDKLKQLLGTKLGKGTVGAVLLAALMAALEAAGVPALGWLKSFGSLIGF